MAFAIFDWTRDQAVRRFIVWMAIGTAFVLVLAATDFFSGGRIG